MKKSLKTPCIGICSTVFGDEVCRGCKRYQNEVIDWNGYTDVEKEAVLIRLEALKTQIMRAKVNIFDEEILREKISMIIGIRAVYYLQGGKSEIANEDVQQ